MILHAIISYLWISTQTDIAYLGPQLFLQIFTSELLKKFLNFTTEANKMEIFNIILKQCCVALMPMLFDQGIKT